MGKWICRKASVVNCRSYRRQLCPSIRAMATASSPESRKRSASAPMGGAAVTMMRAEVNAEDHMTAKASPMSIARRSIRPSVCAQMTAGAAEVNRVRALRPLPAHRGSVGRRISRRGGVPGCPGALDALRGPSCDMPCATPRLQATAFATRRQAAKKKPRPHRRTGPVCACRDRHRRCSDCSSGVRWSPLAQCGRAAISARICWRSTSMGTCLPSLRKCQ